VRSPPVLSGVPGDTLAPTVLDDGTAEPSDASGTPLPPLCADEADGSELEPLTGPAAWGGKGA
jgi:hypothetical protein